MAEEIEHETERLKLRQWLPDDYVQFSELSADPEVMEYFPCVLSESESSSFVKKAESLISKKGWGLWAVELKSTQQFIGFVGLHNPEAKLPFTPCTEIGWRLSKKYWGNGYATEAANSSLQYAFETLKTDKVFSFTSINNYRSRAVMERLGMVNQMQNFEHPSIPKGHKLREHVLYKITKESWVKNNAL